MTTQQVATHLLARGAGTAQWKALCPAHTDRVPSLSIREGRKGRTLLCCHAGCTVTEVLAAAGLRLRDLFAGPPPSREQLIAAARKRDQLEALREYRRVNERVDIDFMRRLERRLDKVVREMGRELALMPAEHPGAAALTAKFHAALTAYQFSDCCIVGDVDDDF